VLCAACCVSFVFKGSDNAIIDDDPKGQRTTPEVSAESVLGYKVLCVIFVQVERLGID
jgi:hypothetical protein